ncbi:hypothetical protein ACFY7C_12095 [Streptomyces sp. NPDC012769]|uniref:hypothetical protein n=1 Tax=Streptomyces sp. NPDC012769 TaxID=3364848 RepID=UPI0036B3FA34
MTLEELITALEAADPTLVLPHGFTNPHSYRGFYEDLAFEPATDVLVADMLDDARNALGETFQGWKGGDYKMRRYTDCWLAKEGHLGETLGPLLVQFMLAAGVGNAARQAAAQQPAAVCHPESYARECPCPPNGSCCKVAPADLTTPAVGVQDATQPTTSARARLAALVGYEPGEHDQEFEKRVDALISAVLHEAARRMEGAGYDDDAVSFLDLLAARQTAGAES